MFKANGDRVREAEGGAVQIVRHADTRLKRLFCTSLAALPCLAVPSRTMPSRWPRMFDGPNVCSVGSSPRRVSRLADYRSLSNRVDGAAQRTGLDCG